MMVRMKCRQIAILLLAPPLILSARAKKPDWEVVERIPPGTHILVTTQGGTECALQKVTEKQLFCTMDYPGSNYHGPHADHVFNRADVQQVCVGEIQVCSAFDASEGPFSLFGALESGGGWNTTQPTSFVGAKIGLGGLSLDLQYDRLNGGNGFSTEGSAVLPVLRIPAYRREHDRLFFRVYGEPGLGYRAGGGPFGQYASAKTLVLFGHKWVDGGGSPYIEFQRRFPFNSLLKGDNRIAVGMMWAVCDHCGLD